MLKEIFVLNNKEDGINGRNVRFTVRLPWPMYKTTLQICPANMNAEMQALLYSNEFAMHHKLQQF